MSKEALELALNAEIDNHLGYNKHEVSSTSNSRNGATRNPFALKMASSNSIHLEIEMVAFSLSWLRRIKLDSPPWMTKHYSFTLKE
jgi:hypothetical protein